MRLYSHHIDLLEYFSQKLKILVAFGLGLRGFIYDDVIFDYQKNILRHVIIYAVYGMGRN